MDAWIAWALLGMALVIVEVFTGTFYLLVLGAACFGAAAAAYAGLTFAFQAIIAVLAAGAGVYLVHAYRARNAAQQMAPIDQGQPARFETWIDRSAGLARVRYRGADWDAQLASAGGDDPVADIVPGALLYVVRVDGNTLAVSRVRPG